MEKDSSLVLLPNSDLHFLWDFEMWTWDEHEWTMEEIQIKLKPKIIMLQDRIPRKNAIVCAASNWQGTIQTHLP